MKSICTRLEIGVAVVGGDDHVHPSAADVDVEAPLALPYAGELPSRAVRIDASDV